MEIRYLGHSVIYLIGKQYNIIFDPFINGNPWAKDVKLKDLKADYILVTHGHGDHLGDTIELAELHNSVVVAPYELAMFVERSYKRVHPMHIGGSFKFPFGKVKLTLATHGSGYMDDKLEIVYTGNPCGFIVEMDGETVYFAGDTGLFYDMKLIGDYNKIDYAFLPIGDNFTMGIDDAAIAAEFLKAQKGVIPIHYDTFDVIKSEPKEFEKKLATKNIKTIIIQPGSSYNT